jgi:hypothetical protein
MPASLPHTHLPPSFVVFRYRFDPTVDPPRVLAMDDSASGSWSTSGDFKRGDVRTLEDDVRKSKL